MEQFHALAAKFLPNSLTFDPFLIEPAAAPT
jgi:hypothetical protein